jgi:aromatic-L-amino-acid decarboxylase
MNQRIMDRLNKSGHILLTHTRLDGRLTLRMCIGQAKTQREHVVRAWDLIREAAAAG